MAKNTARFIKGLRREAGMSQADFCEQRLNGRLDRADLSRLENGLHPSPRVVLIFHEELGIPTSELTGRKPKVGP